MFQSLTFIQIKFFAVKPLEAILHVPLDVSIRPINPISVNYVPCVTYHTAFLRIPFALLEWKPIDNYILIYYSSKGAAVVVALGCFLSDL